MQAMNAMNAISGEMLALVAGEVPAIEVGPGCRRRDLPSAAGVRAWIVEMDPGSQWPHVDEHPAGEDVYVLEGEMIEGEQRYPAGSYLHFLPGSSHRPRTETGLRLFGFNVAGDLHG
jgi:anti-sigma factor ChrR (cupin superfamily)